MAPSQRCAKSWQRTALPLLLLLLTFADACAVLALAVFNIASLEPSSYASKGAGKIDVQLSLYWCLLPFVLLLLAAGETWGYLAGKLRSCAVIALAVFAVCAWTTQVALWIPCLTSARSSPETTPGFCPLVYRDGSGGGRYPDWNRASPSAAVYAVSPMFLLQFARIACAARNAQRERRSSFRRSDVSLAWMRQHADDDHMASNVSGAALLPTPAHGGQECDLAVVSAAPFPSPPQARLPSPSAQPDRRSSSGTACTRSTTTTTIDSCPMSSRPCSLLPQPRYYSEVATFAPVDHHEGTADEERRISSARSSRELSLLLPAMLKKSVDRAATATAGGRS